MAIKPVDSTHSTSKTQRIIGKRILFVDLIKLFLYFGKHTGLFSCPELGQNIDSSKNLKLQPGESLALKLVKSKKIHQPAQ